MKIVAMAKRYYYYYYYYLFAIATTTTTTTTRSSSSSTFLPLPVAVVVVCSYIKKSLVGCEGFCSGRSRRRISEEEKEYGGDK